MYVILIFEMGNKMESILDGTEANVKPVPVSDWLSWC